ncbi:MAG: hypothetical protein AB7E85_03825 [Pseudobdellovibrionaceae bacterium]
MEVLTYLHFKDEAPANFKDYLSEDARKLCEEVRELEDMGAVIPDTRRFTSPAFVLKVKRLFDLEAFQAEELANMSPADLEDMKAFYKENLEFTARQSFADTDRLAQRIRERENRIVSVLNHYEDDPYHSPFWMYPHAATHIGLRDDIEIYETRAGLDMPDDLKPHYDAFFRMSEETISEAFIQIAQEAVSPVFRLNMQAYEQNFMVTPRMRLMAFYGGIAFDGDKLDAITKQFGGEVAEAVYRLVNNDQPTADLSDLPSDVIRDVTYGLRAYCHEALRRGIAECEVGELETVPSMETFKLIHEALDVAKRLIDNDAGTTEFYAICERAGSERAKLAAMLESLGDFEREDEDAYYLKKPDTSESDDEDDAPDIEVEYGPINMNGEIMVPANDI